MDSDKKPTWSHLAAALKPIDCAPSFNIIAKELSNLDIYIHGTAWKLFFFYMRLAKLSLLLYAFFFNQWIRSTMPWNDLFAIYHWQVIPMIVYLYETSSYTFTLNS